MQCCRGNNNRYFGKYLRFEKYQPDTSVGREYDAGKKGWEGLKCIGAVHMEFEERGKKRSERHYYISSRELTAEKLLHHARMEWCVETMHWLLDIHFGEDGRRVEDRNIQQNLNMLRKLAIIVIKQHKKISGSKRSAWGQESIRPHFSGQREVKVEFWRRRKPIKSWAGSFRENTNYIGGD